MDKEIKDLFYKEDKISKELAFKYLTAKGKGKPEVLKTWFDGIKKTGYVSGDIDIRELLVFFNFINPNADLNFSNLVNFYHDLKDCKHKNDFFFLIYMSSIEIQKKHVNDLRMSLKDEEFEFLKGNFKEYENFKNYKLDELFLALIHLLDDSDEVDYMSLNHRRIETIIDLIVKFPATEVSAFIENILKEKFSSFYLNSYLFYINSILNGFINADDLMELIISRFHGAEYFIISQAFFIRPVKKLAFKLIREDLGYICLLKYFDNREIMSYFYELEEIYGKKELFREYFTKLFSIILLREGVEIALDWNSKGMLSNKTVLPMLIKSAEFLKLL